MRLLYTDKELMWRRIVVLRASEDTSDKVNYREHEIIIGIPTDAGMSDLPPFFATVAVCTLSRMNFLQKKIISIFE